MATWIIAVVVFALGIVAIICIVNEKKDKKDKDCGGDCSNCGRMC